MQLDAKQVRQANGGSNLLRRRFALHPTTYLTLDDPAVALGTIIYDVVPSSVLGGQVSTGILGVPRSRLVF
jgi:hypothetical protein